MKFDIEGLKNSVQSIGGALRNMRNSIETLKRQREDLRAAPATRQDVLAALHARIDGAGEKYAELLAQALSPAIKRGERLSGVDRLPILTAAAGGQPTPHTMEQAFCLLFGDQMKAAVEKALQAMPWPEGAVEGEERTSAIERLDAEIARLESEERELANQALEAGVVLS